MRLVSRCVRRVDRRAPRTTEALNFLFLYECVLVFFISLPLAFVLVFCISAFEQDHLEPWRYRNNFIIIIITVATGFTADSVSDTRRRGQEQREVLPEGGVPERVRMYATQIRIQSLGTAGNELEYVNRKNYHSIGATRNGTAQIVIKIGIGKNILCNKQ